MIPYRVEKFTDIIPEFKDIIDKHCDEVSLYSKEVAPLDPDWVLYENMDKAKLLFTYTVRVEQKLIGYYVAVVIRHLHYKQTLVSDCDVFYLLPEYRKGLVGYKLISGAEKELEKMGVKIIILSAKFNKPLEALAKRLGHKPLDLKYFREV